MYVSLSKWAYFVNITRILGGFRCHSCGLRCHSCGLRSLLRIPVPLLRTPVTPADSSATPADSGATLAESGDSFRNQWGTEKYSVAHSLTLNPNLNHLLKSPKKILKNQDNLLDYDSIKKFRVHPGCPRKVGTWQNAIALLTAISIGGECNPHLLFSG